MNKQLIIIRVTQLRRDKFEHFVQGLLERGAGKEEGDPLSARPTERNACTPVPSMIRQINSPNTFRGPPFNLQGFTHFFFFERRSTSLSHHLLLHLVNRNARNIWPM